MVILRIITGFIIVFLSLVLNSIIVRKINNNTAQGSLKLFTTIIMLLILVALAKKYFNFKLIPSFRFNFRRLGSNLIVFVIAFITFTLLRLFCDLLFDDDNAVAYYISLLKNITLSALVNFLLIAVTEEIIFRYYLTSAISSSRVNVHISIFISSALFALVHANKYSNTTLLFILIFGLVFSMIFIITRSLVIPIALHMQHNLFINSFPADLEKLNYSFSETFISDTYVTVLFVILTFWWFYKKIWQQSLASIYK